MVKLLQTIFLTAFVISAANAQWQQVSSPAGHASVAPAVFVLGEHAYFVCGRDTNQVWRYTPASDTWLRLGDHPGGARAFAFAFAIKDKGYVGAGDPHLDTVSAVKDFWEYDPATDTWTQKADFTLFSRAGAIGFEHNGLGFLCGGYAKLGSYSDIFSYDPETDTWLHRTHCPDGPLSTSAFAFVNGKLYIGTGSQNKTTNTDRFWEYDPDQDLWTYKTPFPGGPRQGAVGFAAGGKVVMGCGINGKYARATVYNDFYIYDPMTNAWEPYDEIAFPSEYNTWLRSFTMNNVAYLGWGAKMPGRHMAIEMYKMSFGSMIESDATNFGLNFGAIMVGGSVNKTLTIRNGGSESFDIHNIGITGASSDAFTFDATQLPMELAPGATLQLQLHFTPPSNGNFSATLQVFSNAKNASVYEVSLVGAGGQSAPVMVVTPSAVDFGTIDEGTSQDAVLQIHNEGTSPLTLSNVELLNNGAGGYQLPPLTLPMTVAPGGVEFIAVRFQPPKEGSFTALLRITSNASNGAVTSCPLQGVARNVVRTAEYNKTSFDFSGVQIGEQGVQALEIRCTSAAPVLVSSIVIINDSKEGFAIDIDELPVEISSGNMETVRVLFAPEVEGSFTADLVVNTNADNASQVKFRLSGTGYSAQSSAIALSTEVLDCGGARVQSSKTVNLEIQSVGGLSLRVEALDLDDTGGGAFSLGNISVPFTLASGGTKKVPVIFKPVKAGPVTGILRITSNASANESVLVNLEGFGASVDGASLTLSAAALSFGDTPASATTSKMLKLSSVGTEDAVILSVSVSGPGAAAFSFGVIPEYLALSPGKEFDLDVHFQPTAQRDYAATLRITTNIPGTTELTVPLEGTGVQASSVDGPLPLPSFSFVLFPNPLVAGTQALYTYTGASAQRVLLSVIDIAGRTCMEATEVEIMPGTHPLALSESLSAGRYFVVLQSRSNSLTVPFAVLPAR